MFTTKSELKRQLADAEGAKSNLTAQVRELEARLGEMERVQGQALRLVAHNGPFLSELTQLTGVDAATGTIMGSLTTDQQGIVVDLGAASFVLNPWRQTITVNDVTGAVQSVTVSCRDGMVSVKDQTMVLGHVQRILRTAESGTDPVLVDTTLTGEPVATAG